MYAHPGFSHTDPLQHHFATIPQHVTIDHDDDAGLSVEPCESGDFAGVVLVVVVAALFIALVGVQLVRLAAAVAGGSL